MATLSSADQQYLTKEQQAQIAALKEQYAQAQQAGDKTAMEKAHADAEAIRAGAGYAGGTSGSGYKKLGANEGGQTADQVRQWVEDYNAANWDPKKGWINGYDVAMNRRSKANYIRQQMEANSKAWHTADKDTQDYLHQQNVELAKILQGATGSSDKNHVYDPKTGKWYTWNMDVGYGEGLTQPNIINAEKQYLGYTDEEINRWLKDTSRYYNFVDVNSIRKGVDESSGFTGQYKNFLNGPYSGLLSGSLVTSPDVYRDDGPVDLKRMLGMAYKYDENGNLILEEPERKNNNGVSGYTNQFTAYTDNGVIQPNILTAMRGGAGNTYTGQTGNTVDASRYAGLGNKTDYKPNTADDTAYRDEQDAYLKKIGKLDSNGKPIGWGSNASLYPSSASSGNGLEGYLNQMYSAALEAQLESLKSSYEQNVSDLDASVGKTDESYAEQKRQATGDAAQQAANWREMANAYGLNSGAIGQAGLAQNNQLQSNLNTLSAAQAAAQDEIERQRVLLGQQYQAAINEAKANNNFELAQALYQEAVRKEEQLIQQQQYNSSLALQYAQLAMQQSQWQQEFDYQMAQNAAKTTGRGSGGSGNQVVLTPDSMALGTGQFYRAVSDAAQKNGQSATDYINANYKQLGIPGGERKSYAEAAEKQAADYGFRQNTPEEVYASLSDRLSNSAVFGSRNQMLDLIEAYERSGALTSDLAAKLIYQYGLVG